jgi:radical SAM protein with 4Fe4S-binding SPASM domain
MKNVSYALGVKCARLALGAFGRGLFRFPKSIRIESTNACNGRCSMCPRQRMKRQVGTMDFDLFKRIVDQIPRGKRTIHLHNFGEPLLDGHIFEKIEYCKSKGFSTRMFSNLNLLSEHMARDLIRSGLDDLKVSIDAANRKTYESIRVGLSYDSLVKNIETLVELRKTSGSARPKISVLAINMQSNSSEIDEFEKFWRGKVDRVIVTKLHNWAGSGERAGLSHGAQLPCLRLWQTVTVLWNGDVVPCCMDYDAQAVLGNVNTHSLRDILSSPALRKLKSMHVTGRIDEIPLCRTCELRR